MISDCRFIQRPATWSILIGHVCSQIAYKWQKPDLKVVTPPPPLFNFIFFASFSNVFVFMMLFCLAFIILCVIGRI
jgi:hypothetical protein